MDGSPISYRARWVLPVDRPPIADGCVTVVNGMIVSVGEVEGSSKVENLGEVFLLPAFVNAHVHLDLSSMRGQAPPSNDFVGWLRSVIAHRLATPEDDIRNAIRQGIDESLRFGVTLVGDIAGAADSWRTIESSDLRATVFVETLGIADERRIGTMHRAEQAFGEADRHRRVRFGISPHAPYSTGRKAFRSAASRGLPLATHWLETQAELELLALKSGPFQALLAGIGLWRPTELVDGVEELAKILDKAGPVLLAHGNYWSPGTPTPHAATVVYCPRTHAAFGHPRHPLLEMQAAGIPVVLGTDSLASNPDLDVLAEARHVARHYPVLADETLLRMITLDAAGALGWAEKLGSLTPGKIANLVVVPCERVDPVRPTAALWHSSATVSRVMVDGLWRPAVAR